MVRTVESFGRKTLKGVLMAVALLASNPNEAQACVSLSEKFNVSILIK